MRTPVLDVLVSALSLLVSLVALVGCRRAAPPREDRVVVFAAASLRDTFDAMAQTFQRAHPGVTVTFDYAGTQELRTQLEQGAIVDVLASADRRHMDELARAGRVASSTVFARNEPVMVVSQESAGTLTSLADLPSATRIVLGAADVPIGRYTLQMLDRASITLGADFRSRVEARVVSRELNVRQVLSKVSLGEAQAGIVYRTDAIAARDQVVVITIPPEMNVVAEYPIALTVSPPHPSLARAWVDFVLSPEGQRTLQTGGFLPAAPSGGAP